MGKYLFIAAAVSGIVMLGVAIDARSRIAAEPPVDPGQTGAIYAAGRIEGVTYEVEIRPQLAGRIAEILVCEGQTVAAGQVLLRLDDAEYRCQLKSAAAGVSLAEAQWDHLRNGAHAQQRAEAAALYKAKAAELAQAAELLERLRQLHEARAVAPQQYDNQGKLVLGLEEQLNAAKSRLDLLESPARDDEEKMALARIQAAEAQRELAEVQLSRTRVVAPFAAQVLRCEVKPGELAGPATPEPVVLCDTSRRYVRAYVEELDAPRVAIGMSARITIDSLPGHAFAGRVVRLSPRMGFKTLLTDRAAEHHDTKTREVSIEADSNLPPLIGLRVDVVLVPPAVSRDS